jgi:hypothetical protein
MKHLYFLAWALLLLCSGCNFLDLSIFEAKCNTYIPQKYKFGYQEAEIWTTSRQMGIGDTVFIRAHISEAVMDSLSGRPVTVRGRVSLFFRLSTASYFTSTSPFAMDTTIVRVFYTYFDTFVRTGETNRHLQLRRCKSRRGSGTSTLVLLPRKREHSIFIRRSIFCKPKK